MPGIIHSGTVVVPTGFPKNNRGMEGITDDRKVGECNGLAVFREVKKIWKRRKWEGIAETRNGLECGGMERLITPIWARRGAK